MILRSRTIGAYGPREQAILERMALQIAPAVENAALFQQLQTSSSEMELVDQVAKIMTATLNLDEVYDQFAQELKKLVDYDRLHINVIAQSTGTIEARYLAGPAIAGLEIGTKRSIQESDIRTVMETGQTLVREDLVDSLFERDRYCLEQGLHAKILVPMYSQGEIIASLGLRNARVGAYGPRERAILERLASQIAPAVSNAALYRSSQEAGERATATLAQLGAVLETVGDGIIAANSSGRIVLVNQAVLDMFGYSHGELLGKDLRELMPEESREAHRAGMGKYLQSGHSEILGPRWSWRD